MTAILQMFSGLFCLLIGMRLVTSVGSSPRLSRLLQNVKTKWQGVLVGTGITAVVQSSSAITVLLVGWSGRQNIAPLVLQSLTVGANVGTCVTALLIALGLLGGYAAFLPLVGWVGLYFARRRPALSTTLIGLSLVLIGLSLMSEAAVPLSAGIPTKWLYAALQWPLVSLCIGALLTALLQSSSVTVGMLQIISSVLPLSYGMVVPFIMGQNIGTCITAMLASVGGTRSAKNLSNFHLRFNIENTLLVLPPWLISCIFWPKLSSLPTSPLDIALFHLIFNVIGALYFLIKPSKKGCKKL